MLHTIFPPSSELQKHNLYPTHARHPSHTKHKGEEFFLLRHRGLPVVSTYDLCLPAGAAPNPTNPSSLLTALHQYEDSFRVTQGGSDYGEPESQAEVSRLDLANEELLWFLSREGDD